MLKLSYRNKLRLRKGLKTGLILLLIFVFLAAFYLLYLQRYVVYQRDGVHFDFSRTSEEIAPADPEAEQQDTPHEQVEIQYVEDGSASGALRKVSGYYVTGQMLTTQAEEVAQALEALTEPCSVMLDLKATDGTFYYSSQITGTQTDEEVAQTVDEMIRTLKSRGFQLIARIPAFPDSDFALKNMDCALQISGGALWADENNIYWLDPANTQVQAYLQQICKELSSLGFAEVVFDEFYFPTSGSISYDSSLTKTQIVSQAADAIKNAFTGSNLTISFCTEDAAFPLDSVSGRLYYDNTDGANLDTVVSASEGIISDPASQLVFLTDSRDTRFEAYCTLRPLLELDEQTAQTPDETTTEQTE